MTTTTMVTIPTISHNQPARLKAMHPPAVVRSQRQPSRQSRGLHAAKHEVSSSHAVIYDTEHAEANSILFRPPVSIPIQ